MSFQYFIETYGCQMNKAESAAIEALLAERGWSAATEPSAARMVIINTCSVRETAETRVWGRLAHYAAEKKKRELSLVVTGCMAERLKAELRDRQPAVDFVLGTFQKRAFGLLADAVAEGKDIDVLEEDASYIFAPSHAEPGAFRAFVPIMHGCDNFCSYCIVPYVRGRELSRDPEAILAEIQALHERGVREVTLLGQNVNSYKWKGHEGPLSFAALLARLALRIEELSARATDGRGIGRIRFVSSHPKDLSDETIAVMASSPLFARHIHLCLQHGSDRILAAMNRRYDLYSYEALVGRIRAAMPEISLSTDLLVGFPGETEEDLEVTLQAMRRLRFEYAYMYYFNPRRGTPAATMDGQLPAAVKKERLARVIALQKEITSDIMGSRVGSETELLVEAKAARGKGELLGRTPQDEMAVFPGEESLIGSFIPVRLEGLRGITFKARRLECPGN